MVSLMLSSHQCNQSLERNKETDGGHGSGDPSVSNQRCAARHQASTRGTFTGNAGGRRQFNYADMHVALR